jgi:hypothetical protein
VDEATAPVNYEITSEDAVAPVTENDEIHEKLGEAKM